MKDIIELKNSKKAHLERILEREFEALKNGDKDAALEYTMYSLFWAGYIQALEDIENDN
ncbi:MAG: hypothetical protein QXV17_10750 [Candidatus Micrarchaeaceae archaeon]